MVDRVGRRWALLPAAALLLLLMAPPVAPQTQTVGADLSATLGIPTRMVADDPQGIPLVGTVTNHAQTAVAANVALDVRDTQFGTQHLLLSSTPETFQGGESRSFPVSWNGHGDTNANQVDWNSASPGPVMVGALTFTFSAQPASSQVPEKSPDDNVATRHGALVIHAFAATAPAPDSSYRIDPGSTGVQLVSVKNTGTDDDTALLSVAPAAASDPAWRYQLASTTVFLSASQEKSVSLSVTPPADAAPGTTGSFTLSVASQDQGLGAATLTAATPPASAAGILALQLSDPVTIDPGQMPQWTVTVTNQRNQTETVSLENGAQSDGTLPTLHLSSTSLILREHEQNIVQASLVQALSGTQAAETATWAFTAATGESGAAPLTSTLAATIRTVHKLVMTTVSAPTDLVPGAEATYTFNLKNVGNAATVYQAFAPNLPAGWATTSAQPTSVPIGATQPFVVKVTPPTDATPGALPAGLTFRAFSSPAPNVVPTYNETTLPAQVLARGHPDLTVPDDRLPVSGGQTIHFPVTLVNHGNEAGTYTVGKAVTAASPPTWDVQATPAGPFTVAKGGTQAIDVAVRAPDGTLPADARLAVTLQVRPSGDPGFGQADLPLRAMPAIPDLAVAVPTSIPATLYAGSPATLHVVVSNAGTMATQSGATLNVALRPSGTTTDWITINKDVPVLDWHSSGNQAVYDLALPMANLPAGTTQLVATASIDPHGHFPQAATDNDQAAATLPVRPFSLEVLGPGDRLALPGQTLHYTGATGFTVTNKGTTAEQVNLIATMEVPWAQFAALQVTIPPGQSVQYTGDVLVPPLPGLGVANLTLHVQSLSAAGVERTAMVRVLLDDGLPPIIDNLAATDAVMGVPVGFTARVVDGSGVRSATLFIAFPVGRVVQVPMAAGSGGAYTASYNFTEAGAYTWYVAAEDASPKHNLADTAAQPHALAVRPDRGLALRLLTPGQEGPLKPGSPISVGVQATRTLVRADYEMDGNVVPLAPDAVLRIPTDGWADGPRAVTVHAEDDAGARASGTFHFTLDGTPPAVGSVHTAAAGGGVEVTATVEDPSGVRSVELRYTTASNEGGIVQMEDRGNHVYGTTLALPGKVRTLTFVLEDALGNQGIDPRSPGALLAGSQGSPSPALAAVALALLAAVILRRRVA